MGLAFFCALEVKANIQRSYGAILMKAHLVGGGLASLAAAAYLIRHGRFLGKNINIYEARSRLGGSLGVSGTAATGYIYPGGRVFEWQYRCAMDLFSMVPSSSDPSKSIKQEIAEFNENHSWYNKARLPRSSPPVI
jgi:oleate hydratase